MEGRARILAGLVLMMLPTLLAYLLLQKHLTKGITAADADANQKTTEVNVNYVLKQFNARVMMFFKDTSFDAVRTDFKQFGVGLQIQM